MICHWSTLLKPMVQVENILRGKGDLVETLLKLISCASMRTHGFISRVWSMGVWNFESRFRDFHVRCLTKMWKPHCERNKRFF